MEHLRKSNIFACAYGFSNEFGLGNDIPAICLVGSNEEALQSAFKEFERWGAGEDGDFGWQIAPYLGGKALGSVDGVTAAVLYDYGINNRFEWRLMKRGLISWTFQLSKFDNLTICIDEYNLNAEVNQSIMKNGLLLELPVFSLNSLNANFFLVDTRFLKDANTSNYQTLGLGLGYNNDTFSIQANLGLDVASGYQGVKLDLGCSWDL